MFLRTIAGVPFPTVVTAAHLETAKRTMGRFTAVIDIACFEESLELLSEGEINGSNTWRLVQR
jgi:hypothetical protein